MTKNKKIKILIPYTKPSATLENDIIIPIHAGRAVTKKYKEVLSLKDEDCQWLLDNMIGDDNGENISKLYPHFSTTTAIYWAWKNQDKLDNPDFIGFMNHRRHLSFNVNKKFKYDSDGLIRSEELNSAYKIMHRLKESKINEIVYQNDIIVGKHHTSNPYKNYKSCCDYLHIKDYDLAIDLLKEKYPKLAIYADKYNSGKKSYFYNIFIMKKVFFNEYCEILFDLLFEIDKKIDYENYGFKEKHALGYISEWITGIYLTYLSDTKKPKLKELPLTYVCDVTPKEKELHPAFNKNNIPIVFASNNHYSTYLGVALYSMLKNSSKNNNYDIIILDSDISEVNKIRIKTMIDGMKNVSVRYFNVNSCYKKYDESIFFTIGHFKLENYNRIFIPDIFHNYEKIIYLDSDIVVLDDISNLYNINLDDNLVGAAPDIEIIRNRKEYFDYCENELRIDSVFDYFSSGVMLFNIKEVMKIDFSELCIKELRRIKIPRCVDQCILNAVCKNRIKYIDVNWNIQYHIPYIDTKYKENLPEKYLKKYTDALANPKILHFTSANKPWNNFEVSATNVFWEYAKMTPFYEQIICANSTRAVNWLTFLNKRVEFLEWKNNKNSKTKFIKDIQTDFNQKVTKTTHILSKFKNSITK